MHFISVSISTDEMLIVSTLRVCVGIALLEFLYLQLMISDGRCYLCAAVCDYSRGLLILCKNRLVTTSYFCSPLVVVACT